MSNADRLTSPTWREAIDRLPEITTWGKWGEIFLDVPTWAPLVAEVCRRAALPCRTITPGYPGSNAVFIVNAEEPGNRAIVKIYAPFCHEDYDFEREIHPLLASKPELGAPNLIDHGVLASSTRWPYVVLSYVPGVPIHEVREEISHHNLLQIAADLGERIRSFHAIPLDEVPSLDATVAGWERYVREQISRVVAELRRRTALSEQLLRRIPTFVAGALAEQPVTSSNNLLLVNGDITEDHVLLVEEGGRWRISGLIDFADARAAPRDYEWVALWFGALGRNTAALEAFLRAYDPGLHLNATFYRRAMAFTFLHEFGALIIAEALPKPKQRELHDIPDLQRVLWQTP